MDDEAAKKGCTGSVLTGPFARLLWFLLLCAILLVIGLVKGAIFGPVATLIFFGGIMAVVVQLWPMHVFYIVRAVATTKKLGVSMKILLILFLPIPMLLWPCLAAVGSILLGMGYGIGQPLVGTFEAVGEGRENKISHVFVCGTFSTPAGACIFVRDFFDFFYHSVCDYIEEFRRGEPKDGKPLEIKLYQIPVCALIGLLGVVIDTPAICILALWKSPVMLYKGWSRLIHDLVTRNGPCLEAACVPFAGLALLFWPLIVAFSALAAFLCSPLLGLFSAVVAYQEMSYQCGLKYIVAIVAEFDEYCNDVLHTREGSCLPRPKYRKNSEIGAAVVRSDTGKSRRKLDKNTLEIPQVNTQKSLRHTLQEVTVVQILDSKFASIEARGKSLINAGVLKQSDIDAWMKGNKAEGRLFIVGLSAYSQVIDLIYSAKSNSPGFILADGTEITMSNRPSDRLAEWFFEPIMTIRDQLRACNLIKESEERYLEKLCLMIGDTEHVQNWQNGGVEPEDPMRKAELQALARRIQGIVTAMSRIPTHRRRLENLVKNLQAYMENMDGNLSGPKDDLPNRSKSMKLKSRSFNFRSLMREGSNRFFPPTVPAAEGNENPKEITPNAGDEAV